MARDTHLIVFLRLGWETVLSSIYIVEHEEAFFNVMKSPRELELANCIWERFRTIPFLKQRND